MLMLKIRVERLWRRALRHFLAPWDIRHEMMAQEQPGRTFVAG